MNKIRFTWSLIFLCCLILNCEKESSCNSQPGIIQAKDTNPISVDFDELGNFQFILELENSTYCINENFPVRVYLSNTGENVIQLDGILPLRSSANPPRVHIWSKDGTEFRIDRYLESLNNNEIITIESGDTLQIMDFNLLDVGGYYINLELDNEAQKVEHISELLFSGEYFINASFWPNSPIYSSVTDSIEFSVQR